MPLIANRRSQDGSVLRSCHQCTHMPSWDSENVMKTLIEYMTTSTATSPRGVEEHRDRGDAHQEDAVLRDEPVGELGEAVRHPRVDRHVREDARAVEEARLRRDEEQRAPRASSVISTNAAPDRDAARRSSCPPACRRGPRSSSCPRPECTSREQVAEQDAARRERERRGHVEHRALAGLHARLAQDRDAVRDGLDAGVRAAAQRVGAQEERDRCAEARRRAVHASGVVLARPPRDDVRELGACAERRRQDDDRVRASRGRRGRSAPATMTDSFTPRRFRTMRRMTTTIASSSVELAGAPLPGQEAEDRIARRTRSRSRS